MWKEIYPHHAKRVQDTWAKMEPTWPILRDFRNRTGFHADKPYRFFGARHALRKDIRKVEAAIADSRPKISYMQNISGLRRKRLQKISQIDLSGRTGEALL